MFGCLFCTLLWVDLKPWDYFGKNDAKAETPILWLPHVKGWLIGKDFDAGRDWGQEEKGTTEDEVAGWHHWLYGHESEWTPGVGDGQGGLACCDSWGHKESDTTERLNWTEKHQLSIPHRWLFKFYQHPNLNTSSFRTVLMFTLSSSVNSWCLAYKVLGYIFLIYVIPFNDFQSRSILEWGEYH